MHSFRYGSIMAAQRAKFGKPESHQETWPEAEIWRLLHFCCSAGGQQTARRPSPSRRCRRVRLGSARENARLVAENQKKSGGLLLLLPAGRGKPLQIEGVEIDRVNVKRGVRAATNGVRNDLAREGK